MEKHSGVLNFLYCQALILHAGQGPKESTDLQERGDGAVICSLGLNRHSALSFTVTTDALFSFYRFKKGGNRNLQEVFKREEPAEAEPSQNPGELL